MLKHFLLLCMLAALLSVCYSCGRRNNGGNGGNGGNSGGNGNGGNGGNGGSSGKRSHVPAHHAFALDFDTFDVDRDGMISRDEFLNLQPGHAELFDSADTDGNNKLTCDEFTIKVREYGGDANC